MGKIFMRLVSTGCLLFYCILVFGQEQVNSHFRQLPDFPFVLVAESDTITSPIFITDSLFDAASRGIRFKVNRTELQASDPFIPLYKNQLVPKLKAENWRLRQIFVKGAASPEGPYENNVRLSRERTKRLIDFLNTESGFSPDASTPINTESITEDYGLLVKMMRQANDADYDKVYRIWMACKGDELRCKRQLMSLDNGRVWNRLKEQYFPALRQARVLLYFVRKQAPLIDTLGCMPLAVPAELGMPNINVPEPPLKYERRHLIALRTNLIHDLLYVPQFGWAYGLNLQLEYYPLRGHYTYNVGFTFTNHRRWSDYKFFQIRDLQLELRRYFKGGGQFIGPYLAAYIQGTSYGIGFSKTKGWQGEGGGGGVTAGYTCRLNRKGSLRLEFSASLGVFYTRHDPYIYNHPYVGFDDGLYYYDYYGNARDFKKRNHQFFWFGPTNAGIHITYDIIYRKKKPVIQKGGGL